MRFTRYGGITYSVRNLVLRHPSALLLLAACSGYACSGNVGASDDGAAGSAPSASNTAIPMTDASGNPIAPGSVSPSTPVPDATSPGAAPSTPAAPDTSGAPVMTPGDVDPDVVDAITNAEPLPVSLESGAPLFARTVRLTHAQWERSVAWLLKLQGETGQRAGLTDDALATSDFSNNEELLYVAGALWTDYANAAQELAAQVAADAALLSSIYSGTDAQGFITTFGRRAFRRPLSDAEVSSYQALFDTGAGLSEGGASEFARGAGLVIEAMLQSPNFLYRVELTPPGQRLSGYEVAAKLSLLLRGVTPDDSLLDAAEQGQLDSDSGIETFAQQMLDEPLFLEVMREYHGELLTFNRYLTIEKAPEAVPEYSPELNQELQEAAYLFFDRIVGQSLGVKDILTSNVGFVGPRMAQFYQVPAPSSGFSEVTLPAERPGYFTQLPFLILNSVNMVPDAIHRGVALNLEVLCAEIPPPVANVSLPGEMEGQTNRQRVEAGTGPGTCGATCHGGYINPIGFAFENFDGLGQLRDTDNGSPVDTASTYPFVEGDLAFSGAPELMQLMANGAQVHDCYAKHLAGFALQRDLNPDDQALVDALSSESQTAASSVKQLMLTVVTNSAFTTRATGGAQ